MLRQFSYLNTALLAQFTSALDGGQITAQSHRDMATRKGSVNANLRIAGAEGGRESEQESQRELLDTPPAQFDRLMQAASDDPDALGWLDVTQPDLELQQAGRGTMVSWDCEVFVPEIVQMFGANSQTRDLLRTMTDVIPAAKTYGLDTEGLPDTDALKSMSGMLDAIQIDPIIVGDRDDTNWKIFAKVDPAFQLEPLDGALQVVGKVRRVIPLGSWHPLLSLPGSNFGSREQRRAQAREVPAPDQEKNFVAGPAIELDLLAAFA